MAKAKSAAAATPKPAKKKKGGGSLGFIVFLFLSSVLAITLKAAFLFALIGLLPSIAAYISDSSKNREIYRSVLACNLAGILPQGAAMWTSPNHGIGSFNQLMEPDIWIVVYTFAGLGYLLVWACPFFAEAFIELSSKARLAKLEGVQRQLIEEWGPQIQRRNY